MADANEPPNGKVSPWSVFENGDRSIIERFESSRGKLIIYFERRHCLDPEELAEETLERVMRKLCEGTEVADLMSYSYGVARNVFHEYLRKEKAKQKYFNEERRRRPEGDAGENEDAAVQERRLECLEQCTARLKERERWMLFEYYRYKGQRKLEHRRKIAEQLNISRETLTLRIFHLKGRLKKCINEGLENV